MNIRTRGIGSGGTWKRFAAACVMGMVLHAGWAGEKSAPATDAAPAAKITVLNSYGGRVDCAPADGAIVFDRIEENGRYGIHTMNADGSDVKPLTGNIPDIPAGDVGQPAWHPSGKLIVFQAEKKRHERTFVRYATSPSSGLFNDLYVLDLTSGKPSLIHSPPMGKDCGVLHPHFSRDGAHLSWSQMFRRASSIRKGEEMGFWRLVVGNFSMGIDGPELAGLQTFEPMGPGFYENHGFSPDGGRLIFSSNAQTLGQSVLTTLDIYVLDLFTGITKRLTDMAYNEYAEFSPDGRRIAWMSTREIYGRYASDYWIMNADGSGKRRLTYFNQKGHPHYSDRPVTASDCSWGPDGTYLVGCLQVAAGKGKHSEERIVRIDIPQ